MAAFLVMAVSLVIGNMIRAAQVDRVASVVQTFSGVFVAKMEVQLQARFFIAELARQHWQRAGDHSDFATLSTALTRQFEDLQALNWVSREGVIELVSPMDGNHAALGLDLTRLDVPAWALRRADETDRLQITSPITLAQGGRGIAAYAPVRSDNELSGFINLAFRVDPLIESVLGEDAANTFNIAILDDSDPLFITDVDAATSRFAVVTPLNVGGRTWTISITPTATEIAKAQSNLDELVLLIGMALSISVALILNEAAENRETLERSEERFALAMKGASDGLFDIDYHSTKVFFSPRWFQMLGYAPNALPSRLSTFAELLHPDDMARVLKTPDELYRLPGDVVEEEFRLRHKDGHWVVILSRASILRRAGKVGRVVGTHVDISELRHQQSELERAAWTDDLTGLRNRRELTAALSDLSRSGLGDGRLALFHVDLDRFKAVNDANGHDAGDHVLRQTADRLSAHTFFFDIVARVGGDEFLLAKRTDAENAHVYEMATRIVEAISQPIVYGEQQLLVGASVGIAFVETDDTDKIDEATANADIALCTSKSLGRGRCVFFEPGMRAAAVRAVELASEIRDGLEGDEFKPFFQPQIDTRTREIIGFEALARWYHPKRGILSAADFVSFAERAFLLEAIDDQVFQHACRAVSDISAAGAAEATISVNVSTARLSNAKLVDKLIETSRQAGVDPDRIRIEILETTLLSERTTHITRNIFDLADAGFKLELDDFGTGHTAIASLRNFPVSRIKIDKSLISGVQGDPMLQAISSAVIDLGSKLGIEVLAEGVQTDAELAFLETLGCSQVQGFLIAPPLSMDELPAWIDKWYGQSCLLTQEA
ncbi:bifunctional diguanylate cyclase/phosphodiesterase [Aliiruegeria haliotis]|nr:EAL domain-containing protein [Aliiruegeria haliotis]